MVKPAERRSLALHRAIAAKLAHDPAIVERARERVRAWQRAGDVAPYYADAWAELLARDLADLCGALVSEDERMCTLRQVSPFAGALDPRERWDILRAVQ